MRKCKIDCTVHNMNSREFEITSDGKVWPCCYYANAWDARSDPESTSTQLYNADPVMVALDKEDPTWNLLSEHGLDEIVDHEIYWTHLWYPGWESDNPPPLCVEECGVYIDELSGKETTNSRLD
jgi:hypothetical protein